MASSSPQRALAIPVAPGCAVAAALVPAGPDQAIDIGLHDQLKNSLGDAAQKVSLVVLGGSVAQIS